MGRKIRILDASNRSMQRLGYLKLLCALVNATETSNLNSLGNRLIERSSRRVRLTTPVNDYIHDYVKHRLINGVYRHLRKSVLEGPAGTAVSLEIQDCYLSDRNLPSRTGRLVKSDWRNYPYLGTSLNLIKKGSWSAMTRSLVLLALTPKEELDWSREPDRGRNLFLLSQAQTMIILYCFIDNDADVIHPFFKKLADMNDAKFTERTASGLLPEIFRRIIKSHHNRNKTVEERDKLTILEKRAKSIDSWKGKSYTGGGAPQNAVRVRLEPYCDLGFLDKPDKDRFEYRVKKSLRTFLKQWEKEADTDRFLQEDFFKSFAISRGIRFRSATEAEATEALVQAGETLRSSLGYSPITDVGLLAGIRMLTEKGLVFELAETTALLRALQKRDPGFVRFTVDRMGAMAHVKFLDSTPGGQL